MCRCFTMSEPTNWAKWTKRRGEWTCAGTRSVSPRARCAYVCALCLCCRCWAAGVLPSPPKHDGAPSQVRSLKREVEVRDFGEFVLVLSAPDHRRTWLVQCSSGVCVWRWRERTARPWHAFGCLFVCVWRVDGWCAGARRRAVAMEGSVQVRCGPREGAALAECGRARRVL